MAGTGSEEPRVYEVGRGEERILPLKWSSSRTVYKIN